ncbi:MAG: gluconate 2-dehydrogenase gamma chain [Sulfurimonas sp.]|jgi:gluconate 2-dehydrogenase gamma chain
MFLNSRRTFLKNSFLTTAVLLMSRGEVFGAVTPLDTLSVLQDDLFGYAKEMEVDTQAYLNIIFHHSRVTEYDKKYIRNGVQWINEEALKLHKKTYTQLSKQKREDLLKIISKKKWGESWIKDILTYIMEAMFSDPIYGVNKNQAGQKWLSYNSGLPRAKKALL